MLLPVLIASMCSALLPFAVAQNYVGGYLLIDPTYGVQKLQALAAEASTLPINRLWVSFFSPSMVYIPGSFTLENTDLGLSNATDYGFAVLKSAIAELQAGGVEVFLSMGGWNYQCFNYLYTYYSIGGYSSGPNQWKIQKYSSNGQLSGCTLENMWCYTCEPPDQNTTLADFGMFPEPANSSTWQEAIQFIAQNAGGAASPTWDYGMIPNLPWTDPVTGLTVTVPGQDLWYTTGRDPYQDIVYLAKDLNASGIDLDYEEFWHADYYKVGPAGGPWELPQTVYKYSAIAYDLILNIKAIAPTLKLSTAAPATGGYPSSSNWWGGNLKGLVEDANTWYPSIVQFMSQGANAGGINVMVYDLSDNENFFECPTPEVCTLDEQVNFYMNTYTTSGIAASVGYETGTPAYPDPIEDPENQLPLTPSALALILQNTQPNYKGAFFWEIFKTPVVAGEVSPSQLAQQLCAALLPGSSRCTGSFPASPAA